MTEREIPLCPECNSKMIYSQYSFTWFCEECIKREVGDEKEV